jgi:hypothetical protein
MGVTVAETNEKEKARKGKERKTCARRMASSSSIK